MLFKRKEEAKHGVIYVDDDESYTGMKFPLPQVGENSRLAERLLASNQELYFKELLWK
jgi:hypothetical protein